MDNIVTDKDSVKTDVQPAKIHKRVWEIDFIRGVAILGMVVDHFIFDLSDLNGFFYNFREVDNIFFNNVQKIAFNYYMRPPYIRQYFHNLAGLFFLISGISCTFSHNNMKHGLKIFIGSLIVDVITYALFHISYAINPHNYFDFRILFGVLFSLAIGTLVVALIQKIPHHKWILLGLGIAILAYGYLMVFCYILPTQGWKAKSGLDIWYKIIHAFDTHFTGPLVTPAATNDVFTKIFGLDVKHFFMSMVGLYGVGSDYFEVLPWIGFTLIGAFLGETIYKDKKSLLPKLDGKWHHFFDWVGSKTLWIYLLHQPFNIVVLTIICVPFGYRFF